MRSNTVKIFDSKRARRRTLLLRLSACFALWHRPLLAAEPALPEGLSVPGKSTAMPAFDLPTTAGTTLRSESLRGQVVVIRFWASW